MSWVAHIRLFCFLLKGFKILAEYTFPFVFLETHLIKSSRKKKKSALKLIVNPLKAGNTSYLAPSFSLPYFVQWFTHSKYSIKLKRQCMFQFTLIWRGCIDLRNSWDKKDRFNLPWFLAGEAHCLENFAAACVTLASLTAGHRGILNVLIRLHFCWW